MNLARNAGPANPFGEIQRRCPQSLKQATQRVIGSAIKSIFANEHHIRRPGQPWPRWRLPMGFRPQVKYLGLLENIKVRRAGFAYRQHFDKFLRPGPSKQTNKQRHGRCGFVGSTPRLSNEVTPPVCPLRFCNIAPGSWKLYPSKFKSGVYSRAATFMASPRITL